VIVTTISQIPDFDIVSRLLYKINKSQLSYYIFIDKIGILLQKLEYLKIQVFIYSYNLLMLIIFEIF